ncbi:MAG: bifunctional 4-hydroxy-2-oxoglutarate aldolase/2-dehydro-3-deoxy-phosphogluconate aldolase [Mycobacterium sp.]|uniref:bifunctional 4-hydroxy-2-oxoglutarate aldolase/2-dehydro-3-deoxy-phosphogluconate aldolase n=1 Tax=Mycobacterium sp. TaxID=1785 RepID=UPI00389AE52C
MTADALQVIAEDRAVTVVRAPQPFDVGSLVTALATGGLRAVELTLTTPDILARLGGASIDDGAVIGVGTVLTAEDAEAAIDAGARFLVTPAVREAVAGVAAARNVPVIMGAYTPTEVMAAVDLGAAAVKIFPARTGGPDYVRDLRGPFPGVALIPSGGISAGNAASYLAAGATAVTAGTDVVAPELVDAANWTVITDRARGFVAAISGQGGD